MNVSKYEDEKEELEKRVRRGVPTMPYWPTSVSLD